MKYICKHGTTHTGEEGRDAIEWAARTHPNYDPEVDGPRCWIAEWQRLVAEDQAKVKKADK